MKRWHWILIGASVVVLVLGSAVAIYCLITPPPPEYTIYTVARLIFDFLDKWASAGAPAMTLLAVIAALGIGIATILETRDIQKRERKERLLNEIIEWARDINKASLDVNIPLIDGSQVQSARQNIEANILLRYGIPFSNNGYIGTIAKEGFVGDLSDNVAGVIKDFTVFLFLKEKSFGIKNPEEAFRGTYVTVMEEIDREITEGRKATNQLLYEYSEKLAKSTHELLVTVGKVKASLFAS